mmetsp:Transcript_19933/g.37531  ORF Transcript_19933/g.37531 Transcript_19933/m.37531 type:complete len:268 (-) Transcript_19933:128-931(-)
MSRKEEGGSGSTDDSTRHSSNGASSKAAGSSASAAGQHQAEEGSITAISLGDSSSERSETDLRGPIEAIQWDALNYGLRIRYCRGHAHCVDDIYLLSAFLELAQLPDIDTDSVKLLLRALKLLRLCDYSTEDLCSILSHASAYFLDAYSLCGSHMDPSEVGNVLVTLMFVAHCYVQDETCPLHVWHQHLFRKYCPLRTLNAAIIRLLEIRRYVLRLESQDLSHRYVVLYKATQRNKVESSAGDEENSPVATTKNAILSKVLDYCKYR